MSVFVAHAHKLRAVFRALLCNISLVQKNVIIEEEIQAGVVQLAAAEILLARSFDKRPKSM